jgi:hypothetical protein
MKNKRRWARKCSATGEGMNKGYVFRDGEMYFKYEKDLIAYLRSIDSSSDGLSDEFILGEAYGLEEYYYTEWDDKNDWEYVEVDGNVIPIEY